MNTHSVYTHLRLPLSREKNIIDRASLKRFSEDAESTERLLFNLKDLGIQLSIDDFGTGYSSLSYLHRLPVDTIKIDRSFVGNMNTGDGNYEIVRTIVALAHTLGKAVIAEGPETAEQVSQLRTLGCEYAQGYFFARPMDAESAEAMIRTYSFL